MKIALAVRTNTFERLCAMLDKKMVQGITTKRGRQDGNSFKQNFGTQCHKEMWVPQVVANTYRTTVDWSVQSLKKKLGMLVAGLTLLQANK